MTLGLDTFIPPLNIGGLEDLPPLSGDGPGTIEFFDYFFSDNAGAPADDFNLFIQWQVSGGSVDFVGGFGPGVFGAPPTEPEGRYVDLGGSTGDPGRFETRLAYPVVAGQTYNFTFDYRSTGGEANTAVAMIGGQAFTVASDEPNFQRFSQDVTFETTGVVSIAFQGAEGDLDGSGIGIDGVLFGMAMPGRAAFTGTPGEDTYDGTDIVDRIRGADSADRLSGGLGEDVIFGEDGDDRLGGDADADQVYGGAGADTLSGGDGADRLFGEEGDDVLYGDVGDDTMFGQAGTDILFGSAGDDAMGGQEGDDVLFGEDGNDALFGNEGADTLYGMAGDDVVAGGDGDDAIGGQEGADTLVGGLGADTLYGNEGADVFRLDAAIESQATADGHDTIADFEVFTDRLDLRALRTGASDTVGFEARAEGVFVFVDQGGDGIADAAILLAGIGGVAAGDILF